MKNLITSKMLFVAIMAIFTFSFVGCDKDEINEVIDHFTALQDIDGNRYQTVVIGTQEWMQENLRVTRYRNGDAIETTNADISNETEPKYQWAYENKPSNLANYGRLYTWYAVNDSRGICPAGWRVPSKQDFEILISHLGGEQVAGGKMKSSGTSLWESPNTGATNESGFSANPAGWRHPNNSNFVGLGKITDFWTSEGSQNNNPSVHVYLLYTLGSVHMSELGGVRDAGLSVRCIKN